MMSRGRDELAGLPGDEFAAAPAFPAFAGLSGPPGDPPWRIRPVRGSTRAVRLRVGGADRRQSCSRSSGVARRSSTLTSASAPDPWIGCRTGAQGRGGPQPTSARGEAQGPPRIELPPGFGIRPIGGPPTGAFGGRAAAHGLKNGASTGRPSRIRPVMIGAFGGASGRARVVSTMEQQPVNPGGSGRL